MWGKMPVSGGGVRRRRTLPPAIGVSGLRPDSLAYARTPRSRLGLVKKPSARLPRLRFGLVIEISRAYCFASLGPTRFRLRLPGFAGQVRSGLVNGNLKLQIEFEISEVAHLRSSERN